LSVIPSLSYERIIKALQRDGFVVVRQKGSHIRLQKHTAEKTLKVTVPAHKPVKKTTLARIIKDCSLTVEKFLELL